MVVLEKPSFLKTLSAALRSKGEIVLNVASSGIAVLLLSRGRMAHSRFHIPLHPTDESFCTITPDSKLGNPDSMETPFGGKIVVFGGDFRQILHVIQKGKREDIVVTSLNSSYLWDLVIVLKLTVNIRSCGIQMTLTYADNRNFAQWILDIGNGNVGESEDGVFDIEIPQDLLITDVDDPTGSIISTIYPDYLLNLDSICASQRDADFNIELYTTDFLNSIEVGGLPKHNLRLKVGVPVMLIQNIDQAGGCLASSQSIGGLFLFLTGVQTVDLLWFSVLLVIFL
ncbi:uncharacterized protein [Rutidosis leptorrhynchoides]|uniref:uncharacterized protein n=1 Tax=Rutidosis leptorrhynchoides TaxID=125765 RepID=UPI003A98DD42